MGGDYSEEGRRGQFIVIDRSGIKQPLEFQLPFPYKIYVEEYGLKTEGKKPLIYSYYLTYPLSSLTIMPNLIYYLG